MSSKRETARMMRLMKLLAALLFLGPAKAQLGPTIMQWLINTTGVQGRHYVQGNSTPITDAVQANVQNVKYSANWVYVTCTGIPSYITGPFLDGNPSLATNQNAIFKFPRTPVQNTGTPTATTAGNIGVFINGVALFDYRDGVSWRSATNALAGGPLGGTGDGVWNRDAVVAEKVGFDCAKGHPAMGNYHHHQNPSAFNLDLAVVSNVCDLYAADGLYVIDATAHAPLIGFAYDGFPIYGAYGYANTDGTGGIARMKSSYQLRNITVRTHYADGTDVTDGPPVSTTYPLGYFREDYEFVSHPGDPTYLDVHNGRFCVTPEHPNGTYAYFATVYASHNSAYPYAVGPTFYGVKSAAKVTSITEPVTTFAYVKVAPKVMLKGPYDSGTGLMSDALRTAALLPYTQPYTGLGYTFSGTSLMDGAVAPGVFTTITGNNAVVDWVVVELRNALTPSTVIASSAALLQRDGDIVTTNGVDPVTFSVPTGTYHVAVRHRNHLGVMTATAVALGPMTTTVDLLNASAAVYGTNATAVDGAVRLLWCGDVTTNHVVSYTGSANDRDPILTAIGGSVPTVTAGPAYTTTDVNMDGTVKYTGTANDRDLILNAIGGTVPTATLTEQLP